MTRAYIRLDPMFDEHKSAYPDGPYSALIACFCLAEHQPKRGWFRSVVYLKALLERRGRHVGYLIDHGDLDVTADGRVYLVGWDEWQEGDWKVGERVQRIRNRRGCNGLRNGSGNAGSNGSKRYIPSEVSAGAGADKALALTAPARRTGLTPIESVTIARQVIRMRAQ